MADAERLELIARFKLTPAMLGRKCSNDHLLAIAGFISWREVARHLAKIDRTVDIQDIQRDCYDEAGRRQKLVDLWTERNGHAATYDAMITAMLKARKATEAENVCEMLNPNPTPTSCADPTPTSCADPNPPPPGAKSRLDEAPTLVTLGAFKKRDGTTISILAKLGTDYTNFGIYLLNDGDGTVVEQIDNNHRGQAGPIMTDIARKWIRGQGKQPITWQTLLEVIHTMNLKTLETELRGELQ